MDLIATAHLLAAALTALAHAPGIEVVPLLLAHSYRRIQRRKGR